MKISKSKQELARIISENGGWRNGAEWAAQDACGTLNSYQCKPVYSSGCVGFGHGGGYFHKICATAKIKNWHQTILSREEYFHLYPAPDADGWIEWKGGECPVGEGDRIDVKFSGGDEFFDVSSDWGWGADAGGCNIIAYRLHKPEQAKPELCESVMRSIPEPESKPTIEQLASDYRNKLDYANRKQDEADKANMESDAALSQLEDAIAEIGFAITPLVATEKEPDLVIADWRDLRVGDEVEYLGGRLDYMIGRIGVVERIDQHDGRRPIKLSSSYIRGDHEAWPNKWRFIRRP